MDDAQHILRTLSRHRHFAPKTSQFRPEVALSCWRCGMALKMARPNGPVPCSCGGAFVEVTAFEEDSPEE